MVPEDLIRALPKTDLHVHLDGSLRLGTLIELARERKVKLPSRSQAGLRKLVFKDRYESLPEYLQGFGLTCAVMRDPEALERIAYELAEDNYGEGVRYFEVRFAPQLHATPDMDMVAVLRAVNRGLQKATRRANRRRAIQDGRQPEFRCAIIVCALRYFAAGWSPYYRSFFDVHPFTRDDELYALGSLELAHAAVEIRDRHGLPITGFDLAGMEEGYPAGNHRQAYDVAHHSFLHKTVHAGEAYGPESIFQAITDLHADRIGHGYYLLSRRMIKDRSIVDKGEYIRALSQYIADRRITIEVCLTSNLQTNPRLQDLSKHTFKKMRAERLSTTLCTDNRLVSNTTVTNEMMLAVRHFGLAASEVRDIIIYGFKRSFFPGSYIEKRAYVRRIIDFYDEVAERHELGS